MSIPVSQFTLPPIKPLCPRVHSPHLGERLTLDWKVKEGDMGAEKNPLWKEPGKSIPGKENSMCKGPEAGVCLVCWRQCVWTGVRGRVRGEQVGEASREQLLLSLVGCGQESRFYSQLWVSAGAVFGLTSMKNSALRCACLHSKIGNCHLRTWHAPFDIFGVHMVPRSAL